jgi:hypothetical protein
MSEPVQKSAAEPVDLNAEFQEFQRSAKYQSALFRESVPRDCAWLKVPRSLCGIDTRPLSARDLLTLFCLRSPFLSASFLDGSRKPISDWPEIEPEGFSALFMFIPLSEVVRFLWIHSCAFKPIAGGLMSRIIARRRFVRFAKRCRRLKYGQACEEIRDYMNESLADGPGGKSTGPARQSVASWVSSDIHLIASAYGWTADYILDMPIAQMFQCERRILNARNVPMRNPSDELKIQWLREARARVKVN